MVMIILETIKVGLTRELTDYEMRRLGETCDLLGFHYCQLNGEELLVSEMCKTDVSWEAMWAKFDEEKHSER